MNRLTPSGQAVGRSLMEPDEAEAGRRNPEADPQRELIRRQARLVSGRSDASRLRPNER